MNCASPDLWEPREGNLPGPPDSLSAAATDGGRDALISDIRTTQGELVEVDARMRTQRERLSQLLQPAHVDEAEAARVTAQLIQSEGRVKTLHLGLLVRIKNRLTPEQQVQLRGQGH